MFFRGVAQPPTSNRVYLNLLEGNQSYQWIGLVSPHCSSRLGPWLYLCIMHIQSPIHIILIDHTNMLLSIYIYIYQFRYIYPGNLHMYRTLSIYPWMFIDPITHPGTHLGIYWWHIFWMLKTSRLSFGTSRTCLWCLSRTMRCAGVPRCGTLDITDFFGFSGVNSRMEP